MQFDKSLAQLLQSVEQNGVYVEREIHGFPMTGVDIVLPHVVLLFCLRGSARVMIDMQEFSIEKNDFGSTHARTRLATHKVFRRFRLCTRFYLSGYDQRAEDTCLQP